MLAMSTPRSRPQSLRHHLYPGEQTSQRPEAQHSTSVGGGGGGASASQNMVSSVTVLWIMHATLNGGVRLGPKWITTQPSRSQPMNSQPVGLRLMMHP